GALSLLTTSSSEDAPVAPSFPSASTVSAFRSYTTHSCEPFIKRRAMFAPIRPRPIIPICIVSSLYLLTFHQAPCLSSHDQAIAPGPVIEQMIAWKDKLKRPEVNGRL